MKTASKAEAKKQMTTPSDWRSYASRITAAWQKAVGSIIETGKLLIEAKDKVDHGDWHKLVEELPFGERTAQMLMAVANNPVLSDANHGSDLPPSWRTLYELTKLPRPVLLAKIEDHTINPGMEREDVRAITASVVTAKALATAEAKVTEAEWPKSPKPDEVIEDEAVEVVEIEPTTEMLIDDAANDVPYLRLAVEHISLADRHSPDVLAAAILAIVSPTKPTKREWHPPPTIEQFESAAAFLMKVAEAMRRKAAA